MPTTLQTKEMPSAVQIKEYDEEKNILKGYASTFGGEPDAHGDVIVKGAFEKTIREDGNRIKYLFGHDWTSIIGRITKIYEDDRGLFIEAKISDTAAGKDFMTLVKDGVIDRMSIGYVPTKWKFDNEGICYLEEIKLFEVSGVGLPANDRAVITQAKELQREKEAMEDQKLKMTEESIRQLIEESVKQALVVANEGTKNDESKGKKKQEPDQEKVSKYLSKLNELVTKKD